jgi:hypothetical protein
VCVLTHCDQSNRFLHGIAFATQIAVDSNRNLRKAILMLEACKVERYPFTETQKPRVADWERFIGSSPLFPLPLSGVI